MASLRNESRMISTAMSPTFSDVASNWIRSQTTIRK